MSVLNLGFYFQKKEVYIGKWTMEALGMPEYLQIFVNEKDKCLFLKGCEKDLDAAAIKINYKKREGVQYYHFISTKFLRWMAELLGMRMNSESISFSGQFVDGEDMVYFDLMKYRIVQPVST